MSVFIPAYLQQNLLRFGFGAEGTRWLADLPQHIAQLAQEWGLHLGPVFDQHGAVSWVAPVALSDGSEAVLKITFPHDEPRYEAQALRSLDGRGTVRVLRASDDGFSLLLERCRPGTALWSLGEAERTALACQLLPRIWREPAAGDPFLPLADYVAPWWEDTLRGASYAGDAVAAAVAQGRTLAAHQPRRVLLHGDFHPGNVLAAQREPWLVIDPKPLVGDPAYDLAQWLYNCARFVIQADDAVAVLRRQVDRFAVELGLDPVRIAGWALVKALRGDWGPEYLMLFQHVARTWEGQRRG